MRYELEFSPQDKGPFQPEISYKHFSEEPAEVARKSVSIMDRYFSSMPEASWDRLYLANQTLDLVYAAKKGFLKQFQNLKSIGRMDARTLDALLRLNRPYLEESPNDEESETFARMYIAFGLAPDIATHDLLEKGYARCGMLEPPVTTEEIFGNIREIGNVVTKMIRREVQPTSIIDQPRVAKTYWTLYAMGMMPFRSKETELQTISDLESETWKNIAVKFNNPEDR